MRNREWWDSPTMLRTVPVGPPYLESPPYDKKNPSRLG